MFIKQQALGGFKTVKDDELLVRGTTVLQAMTDNAHFPAPSPPLTDLETHLEDFQEKLANARRRGSPQDTAIKNDSRQVLASTLKQLAFHVTTVSDGVLQKLLSSGFEVSGYPTSGDVPNGVTGIFIRDGRQSGQMRLDFNREPSALLYEYRYTADVDEADEPIWNEPVTTSSSRQNILAPLVPFRRYFVQVRAMNGYGKSDWSAIVSHIPR